MTEKDSINGEILIRPLGRTYKLEINGYAIHLSIPAKDEIGMHPLDILQNDLQELLIIVSKLERFRLQGEQKEKRYRLDDILYPKQN